MIQLAEKNRKADNVDFMLYDGIHFPMLSYLFDIILSVWVLQYMQGDTLKKTLFELTRYLKKGGKIYLIEQVSDNPKVERPKVEEYLQALKESKLECLEYYPIRNSRWWLLYLIRYGMIPKKWFRRIARYELKERRRERGFIRFYKDYLFILRK
jgi:ubiquinone/menaquinone biosynthesis C-methylase UbiE